MIRVIATAFWCVCTHVAISQRSPDVIPPSGEGRAIYESNCLACHQADGSGVPNLAPPLIKGAFVGGDKTRVIKILLEGLEGVEINGEYYANPMPSFGYLSDTEIAEVLTYVRSHFTNEASAVTAEEVKQARKGK